MLKLEENPPLLHPVSDEIPTTYGEWWVAHTKSRNEKALAQNLLQHNIPYFLPLVEKVSKKSGRTLKSMLPLFSGYLFFSGNQDDRQQVFATNRVAQVIDVVDQESLVRDLGQIHQALTSGVKLDPHPHLQPGTICRVVAGPLMGLEGVLLQKKSVSRLILKVNMLGQGASMEIDADLLEPIE